MKRTLGRMIATVGVVVYASWVYLTYQYAGVAPRHPEPAVGRTYPMNLHGTIVYLTGREDTTLNVCFIAGLVCMLAGGALIAMFNREQRADRSAV